MPAKAELATRDWAPAVRAVSTAAVYFAVGEASRLLAILPGYASPVWPAAGIALVAVMYGGWAAALGVLVGASLVNFHSGLAVYEDAPGKALVIALVVGVGAVLQAGFGAWAVRRAFGPGNPLQQGAGAPAFLLVAGPLACVVNAVWSVAWLRAAGIVGAEDVVSHVLTWWAGDTIGVMLVGPLALAWLAREERGFGRWATLFVPLLLCLSSVVFLFLEAERRAEADVEERFETRAEGLTDELTRELDRIAAYTESIARACGAIPSIDRAAFASLVRPWLATSVAVAAFEWVPHVPAQHRAAFELASRDEAAPDFRILENGPDGRLVPAAARAEYAPVLFLEPLEEKRAPLGFDLASVPARRVALERARDTGQVAATEPVRLVPFPDEWGVLLLAAAYGGLSPPRSVDERRLDLRGYAASVLRVDELADAARVRANAKDLVVRVTDLSGAQSARMTGPPLGEGPEGGVSQSTWHDVGGRRWRIDVLTSGPAPPSWTGWLVLTVGLGWTGLIVAYVLDARAQAIRVDRLVQARTAELARAVDELALSNAELRRFAYVASHDLREPLRTITTFSELVAGDPRLDERSRGYLSRVSAAARRMQGRVTDLLALGRLESAVQPFADVRLDEVLATAVDALSDVVEQAGATVRIGPLPTVSGDRMQLVQVFQHLLSNALKFRRPGVPAEVSVEARPHPDGCEVIVRDNGIGIEARDQARIFEIFQQLHPEGRYPGKGVGLATCRRIMERHRGRIWVESRPGEGSTFHVLFPSRRAA